MTPALEAAFRLACSLPSRTHVAREPVSQHWRATNHANNTRPVRVNGTVYESLTEAGRQLGCCREKIRNMTRTGEAEYV